MAVDLAQLASRETSSPVAHAGSDRRDRPPAQSPGTSLGRILTWQPRRKVSDDHLSVLVRQLSLLLRTGNALAPSLDVLARQFAEAPLGPILEDVHRRLEEGAALTVCLGRHPGTFDHLFVSILQAGEAAGALRESLDHLGDMIDSRRRLQSRIREAMTYPMILSVVMVIVLGALFGFMLPRFKEIFADMGSELPWITRALLSTADLVHSRWPLLIPISGVAGLAFWRIARLEAVGSFADDMKLRLPLVRRMVGETCMYRVFLSMGLLIRSRVPMLEAIRITTNTVSNRRYRRFFQELHEDVEHGRGLSPAFARASFLPDAVKLMIATGERSGSLDQVMARLSERYFEELESDIRKLSSAIEPVLLVVMGVMVAIIAFSLILPLFKLSGSIR